MRQSNTLFCRNKTTSAKPAYKTQAPDCHINLTAFANFSDDVVDPHVKTPGNDKKQPPKKRILLPTIPVKFI